MPPRTCIHTKTNGIQCGSPAMRGDLRCYYHFRQRKPLRRLINLADLSTPNGRQEALGMVFRAITSQTIDLDTADRMLRTIAISMRKNT